MTAVIQVRGGQEVTLDEIARFVRDTLGGVKASKRVEIWPDLPCSAAGKIAKTEIK